MATFKAKQGNKIKLLNDVGKFGKLLETYVKGDVLIAFVEDDFRHVRASFSPNGYPDGSYTLLNEDEYELVETFKVGHWYEFKANRCNNIAKCKSWDGKDLLSDDWILSLKWVIGNGWRWNNPEFIRELKVEDECIQKYLPENHVDKVSDKLNESLVGRWIKALKDQVNGSATKTEEYYKIIKETKDNYELNTRSAPFISKSDIIEFELMPIGWEPNKTETLEKTKLNIPTLEEAEKRFPIGTKFTNTNMYTASINTKTISNKPFYNHMNGNKRINVNVKEGSFFTIWKDGIWAIKEDNPIITGTAGEMVTAGLQAFYENPVSYNYAVGIDPYNTNKVDIFNIFKSKKKSMNYETFKSQKPEKLYEIKKNNSIFV